MINALKKSPSRESSRQAAAKRKPSRNAYKFTQAYLKFSGLSSAEALESLETSFLGLTEDEVALRTATHGRNEIVHEKKTEWHLQLAKGFLNPFILLLIGLAVVCFFTDDIPGAVIVSIMVLASTLLTFFQEHRSTQAAERLKAMVTNTATVLRRKLVGQESDSSQPAFHPALPEDVSIAELVPGDLIMLAAGDMIPADLKLLTSKDLFISQAALTGESLPVEKQACIRSDRELPHGVLEQNSLCFMGSNVVSGSATALVLKTGGETYFGSIAKTIVGARVQTGFDKGINKFTWLMLRFMMVMVPLVFLVNGLAKGNWLEAFTFAIAVAVGLTPEMLPMIVTVNLAKGALSMAKQKVIVKRLHSIQNFGAMDVLCTDKTGTLTQDEVALERYVDVFGLSSRHVLELAYLNSFYQTGLKNLLDKAVLRRVELQEQLEVTTASRKYDEIPFDFERRRMSVIVEEQSGEHLLICKGALEEVVGISHSVEIEGEVRTLDEDTARELKQRAHEMNEEGLRVIAVAYRRFPASTREYAVRDEGELVLAGFIGFLDPPKESAKLAISALRQFGVRVKVLTGDNDVVTRKIAKEVGLSYERIVLGHEVEAMDDAELARAAEDVDVFAKLTPAQKERIIKALQSADHVVGFLGDGINDAPALRAADVGISVDNAVDIAKESADIILLEKDLLVLERGALEGRKVFGNIIKYIKMGASSNFGNMFSVLGASVMLPFLPMLPVQLLVQNLLYDLSQTAIPFDQVDPEYLTKPRRWEIGDIGRFMACIGPVSSIFDYATFALMWFVFHANTPENQSLFQSGWFVEGLLSQTLIVHMIRTQRIPFLQSRASWALIATTAIVISIGIYIPYSGLAPTLGLVPLPKIYFAYLIAILGGYIVLTHYVKNWFIRRFGFN